MRFKTKPKRLSQVFAFTLIGFGLITACARQEKIPLETQEPEAIYRQAELLLASGQEEDAAQMFTEVERLYPYSAWAKRGSIQAAAAYHQDRKYEKSRAAAQRYLDFYPADEDAAYAQYLIALSYYDQIDNVSRDQGVTFQALQALRTVVERYPDSGYADSALLKFDLALDHLAAKEMEIGRYYLRRAHYGAAINRFRVVVEEFQTTTHTAEALHRLVEAYLSLGMTEDARIAAAILGHNFRGTDWYQDSYALVTGEGLTTEQIAQDSDGWLARIYRQVIQGNWL